MNRSKKQVRRQSRRQSKQQSKRRSQQMRRQSLRKQSKSRQSRKQLIRRSRRAQRVQRGGNYFFDVASPRIGGLPAVARVDDPIAPIAGASTRSFPAPLYQQPEQPTVAMPSTVATSGEYKGNGMTSVFHDTMTQRDFSCKGPEWAPSCI